MITTIPFWSGNAQQAERLVDWIFWLNDKKPRGHVLIVADHEVHAEVREKIKISAELAFDSFEVVRMTAKLEPGNMVNQAFKKVAEYVKFSYRTPFLWLEPDSVPVVKGWQKKLADAYNDQPKKFCSGFVKVGEKMHISRHGIFCADAIADLGKYLTEKENFTTVGADLLALKTTEMKLVKDCEIRTDKDIPTLTDGTLIVHGDKHGLLLKSLRK